MNDLLTDFIAETREMMEAIEGEIIAWEANPADSTRIDAIFRFVHTVKGNCGFFDFPRLERLSHVAEDTLADVRSGKRQADADLVTNILMIIDCIDDMVRAIEAGEEFPLGREDPLLATFAPADNSSEDSTTYMTTQTAGLLSDKAEETATAAPRSIRLPVDLLDRVMSGISDMVLARNDLANRLSAAGTQPTIDGPFERLTTILNDVRDAITRMRMQPIEQLFSSLPRLVRDLSADLGKKVMIDLEGSNVELDREVIEVMRDPLTHIIRNALDHGFEKPEQRVAAGKREEGLLRIAARQSGNRIVIVITDDGRGLNEEKIAEKAIANGLITPDERAKMDPHAVQQLIFEPGLSTASRISNISGRGFGMDVVRENLERVGGWIVVRSTSGEGTSVVLHIPLTLSIISGLIVEVAGQRFAIPQSFIDEIEFGSGEDMDYVCIGDANLVTMRGMRTSCLSLDTVLGLQSELTPKEQTFVLLRLAKGDMFAIAVDAIHNIGDIVVKPLPPALLQTGCYAGTALLDDGQPTLLLDMPKIAQDNGLVDENRSRVAELIAPTKVSATEDGFPAMQFVALDGQTRIVRLEMVKRIETLEPDAIDISGNRLRAVVDDQIIPIATFTTEDISHEKMRFLLLSDGEREILYPVSKVKDAITIKGTLIPADEEPFIESIALIDGHSIGLIDGHAIFDAFGSKAATQSVIVCSLPDTHWARSMLAPLVSNGGYHIVYDSKEADIAITIDADEAESSEENTDKSIIRLRSMPDDLSSKEEKEHSIYRYDRAAVLSALNEHKRVGERT